MRITCPHCHDELDVEEAWAGHEAVCPLCQNGFVVPHSESVPSAATGPRPKPNRKLEAWNRRRRTVRFLFPLAALGLLAASLWGFNRWRGETPPADALRYFADHLVARVTTYFQPPPPPPAPIPAATPAPAPEPVAAPGPDPEPPAADDDPVAWLMKNPDRQPETVTLREDVTFPAMYEGRVAGKVEVPAGARVKLVRVEPDSVTVRFREGTRELPHGATDLREAAAQEMTLPASDPSPPVAAAPSPVPLPTTATAVAAAEPRQQTLGAVVQRDAEGRITGTDFRVWAPHAETVSVTGSFNNWKPGAGRMTKDKNTGIWSARMATARPGDEYMFLVNADLERRDPRGRAVSKAGKSVVHDPLAFDWEGTSPPEVTLNDLVIYQMHPGTFHDPTPRDGEPGTLRDAATKLDHLEEVGVNCVLLMPVNEFNGRHSWGYNPSDQFAVESTYGGPDALKEFVKACHARGIAVHLDIVHNHYGPQDLSLWQFDGYNGGETKAGIYFYEDAERGTTPWGPRPDFGRPEVRAFIADQVRMWFDEYRIDGLRWDSVVNILRYNDGAAENPDGEKLIDEVSALIRKEYPGKISIAEDAVGNERFDGSWEYAFHHAGSGGREGVVPQLVRPAGETDVRDIASRLSTDLGLTRVIYTENHDETGKLNGKRRLITEADEEDPHSLTARRKSALAAVLTLTAPGVPMIFMGQELLEDAEFHDSNPIDWGRGELSQRSTKLYRDLIRLRRNLDGRGAALLDTRIRITEQDPDRQLLVYRRYLPGAPDDDLVVVVNFSPDPVEDLPVVFPRPADWKLLVNTDDPQYGEGFTGVAAAARNSSGNTRAVSLAPFSAQIYGVAGKGGP